MIYACLESPHPASAYPATVVPSEPPDGSGAVWFRDGRCEDVLAELFELQEGRPQ